MDLTDAELTAVYRAVYNEAYYGDDEVVYGHEGETLASAAHKMMVEMQRRGTW